MTAWHLPFCATVKIIAYGQVCIIDNVFTNFFQNFMWFVLEKKQFLC